MVWWIGREKRAAKRYATRLPLNGGTLATSHRIWQTMEARAVVVRC